MALVGCEPAADFEIGSVSKGLTGLLYADAVDRGEVSPTTSLGELLPLAASPVAGLTLAALSTHRSGLPRLPAGMHPWRRTVELFWHGTNPYRESVEDLLLQAQATAVGRPRAAYSNLGFELLGHAVAAAAGTSYADLVRVRLAEPLGLDCCYVPVRPDELRPGAVRGVGRFGRPREPWIGEALGPAGGVRMSVESVARLIGALLDGSAPGMSALDPVERLAGPAVRIGAGWVVLERRGRVVTWHNGGTGGFRSWVGLDREAGTGAVVLSARAVSVDRAGLALLDRATA